MNKRIALLLLVILLSVGHNGRTQCSMCRRVAESGIESGEKKGRGLNTGILYLMSLPYLLGGVAGYVWWKNTRKTKA